MVVLDTDHMTFLARASSPEGTRLRKRLEHVGPDEWGTTIVTFEEQMRGWLKFAANARMTAKRIDAYRKLKSLLNIYCPLTVLEFDDRAGVEFDQLQQFRLRIGKQDELIAAIVLAQGATLLTRNMSHFRKVPGLRVEDWTV